MNKFIIRKDKQGKFYWVLYAFNGQPIARSNSSYSSLSGCYNGIESVRKNVESEIKEDYAD